MTAPAQPPTDEPDAEKLATDQTDAEEQATDQTDAEKQATDQTDAEKLATDQTDAEKLATDQTDAEKLATDQTDATDRPRILIPLDIFEGETVPPGVIDLLSPVETVLLGFRELPEQTPPGQARMQFEQRGMELLSEIADAFREAGGTVETVLVFTHDEEKTITRVAEEQDCDATLVVQPAPSVDHVYVALRSPDDVDRIGRVLVPLVGSKTTDITLRFLDDGSVEEAVATDALSRLADHLQAAGVTADAIGRDIIASGPQLSLVAEDAAGADLVVMADPEPSLREFLLGDIQERLASTLLAPVLVVGTPSEAVDDGDLEPE